MQKFDVGGKGKGWKGGSAEHLGLVWYQHLLGLLVLVGNIYGPLFSKFYTQNSVTRARPGIQGWSKGIMRGAGFARPLKECCGRGGGGRRAQPRAVDLVKYWGFQQSL